MTTDSYAIVILCSQLCVGDDQHPLSPTEWSSIAQKLYDKGLTPGNLLEFSCDEIIENIGTTEELATRILKLVSRSGSISFEISNLENSGIQIITRADVEYPRKFMKKIGKSAPPILFCAGDISLLAGKAIGFAGSRNADADDMSFTVCMAEKAVSAGFIVVSGGARGIDRAATSGALNVGGSAIEFLADSMYSRLKSEDVLSSVQEGQLLLTSAYKPDAGFSIGNAMGRNKLIYSFSEATIAVKSDYKKGGTWSGATECLNKGYCTLYCREMVDCKGNNELIKLGALPITETWSPTVIGENPAFIIEESPPEKNPAEFEQMSLF